MKGTEFPLINFRESPVGRQAYVRGSSLAVWEVMMIARHYNHDAAAVAKHLEWPEAKVQAALNYSKAFPEEIKTALAENDAVDFAALKRMLPEAEKFLVRSGWCREGELNPHEPQEIPGE